MQQHAVARHPALPKHPAGHMLLPGQAPVQQQLLALPLLMQMCLQSRLQCHPQVLHWGAPPAWAADQPAEVIRAAAAAAAAASWCSLLTAASAAALQAVQAAPSAPLQLCALQDDKQQRRHQLQQNRLQHHPLAAASLTAAAAAVASFYALPSLAAAAAVPAAAAASAWLCWPAAAGCCQ
jgi:hypothetical protein